MDDKWVFVRKKMKRKKSCKIQAKLVAQSFIQLPRIDYDEMDSLMIDAIAF